MARARADSSIDRVVMDGFQFPLGVYPTEPMEPRQGYSVDFEPADGDDTSPGGWEEWPDRYVFEIVISAERLEPLCRSLFGLFPGRVFPILDVLGQDAYREVDPYIAYELVGLEHVLEGLRRYRAFFFEDGLCGFGAMSDDPFFYVFADEHKIVTARCEPELKERVERVLHAFDLEPVEAPLGADATTHEHRGVLEAPEDRPDLLTSEEIVENLRDQWRLTLNIDPETNLDDQGEEMGATGWRCLVRCATEKDDRARYLEVLLTAGCLRRAEELALDAAEEAAPEGAEDWDEAVVIAADRARPDEFAELLGGRGDLKDPDEERIRFSGWLE